MSTTADDRSHVLVDPPWVASRLGASDLVLVEVNDRPELYHLGHPPTARLVTLAEDLQDPVRRDIPSDDAMATLWRRLGVRQGCTVVFYGDLNNWLAAYGYWLFKSYGLPDVRLLDGGRQAWLAGGGPRTNDVPAAPAKGSEIEPHWCPGWRADRAHVARAAGTGALLDVRTRQEYVGEWLTEPEFPGEAAHRPGHIPGAMWLPWDAAVNVDGFFKPSHELRELYEAAGFHPQRPTVTYCRIGERSAHTWFVLHELLNYHDVRNYDGSWTEWGSMTGMPIQLGPESGEFPAGFTP